MDRQRRNVPTQERATEQDADLLGRANGERVAVALTGGTEGETLLRRGALIASRSPASQILAVHVTSEDDPHPRGLGALAAQRTLAESLGGTYHQVVGDDIPRALVDFARSVGATQLVIGVSRRRRFTPALTGPGIGAAVIRDSGDIDVHVVNHAAAARGFTLPLITGGALSVRRRVLGFLVALIVGPLLTWLLFSVRSAQSITSDVLAFQLLVILVALIGGIWPALFAAVMSGLTLDFLFVAPQYEVTVSDPLHLYALLLYVVNAVLVSYIVDQAARRARSARRSEAESELLGAVAGNVLRGESAVPALIARTREAFGLAGVRLVAPDGAVLATDGEPLADNRHTTVPVGDRAVLELHGDDLDGAARRLLDVIVSQLDAALERTDLSQAAATVDALAETDQVRTALLSALSHDIRRPLSSAVAAVSGLRTAESAISDDDRRELLATADESLATLTALVTDLLDVSRVQAGVLAVSLGPVDPADVVLAAIDELGLGPAEVELALEHDVPTVVADGVLLQRVVVNVLANAERYTAEGTRVQVTVVRRNGMAEIRVLDRGPGVIPSRKDEIFAPFQRLGDTDNSTGLGLGLALSRGFTEGMGGTLTAQDTPGGGLTMVIALPVADADEVA